MKAVVMTLMRPKALIMFIQMLWNRKFIKFTERLQNAVLPNIWHSHGDWTAVVD